MIKLALPILLLLLTVSVAAQNPSWDRWPQDKEVRDEMRILRDKIGDAEKALAEMRGAQAATDKWLYGLIGATGLLGANETRRLAMRKRNGGPGG